MHIFFAIIIVFSSFADCFVKEPDPPVSPSKGGVWPKPQQSVSSPDFLIINRKTFRFQVTGEDCNLIQDTLTRYQKIMYMDSTSDDTSNSDLSESLLKKNDNFVGFLNTLEIRLSSPCKGKTVPEVNMKEEYVLSLTTESGRNYLTASSIWGILRGLETFSQLIYEEEGTVKINSTHIYDYPRYPYRGLMVDTARHFMPMSILYTTLDAMSYNKMNVFHWHITDDQSFPFISKVYPELSKKGAFAQSMTYSISDVQAIIEYAAARGIRVIPEFDTPGHTKSWGKAIPELLTPCYINGTLSGNLGPMDPTRNTTYQFLQKFYQEVLSVFEDPYIHLGGDEVELDCWEANSEINNFISNNNLKSYSDLEGYFLNKLFKIVGDLNDGASIVWEEVFTNNVTLDKSTIVHLWIAPWNTTIANVTNAGHNVILSAGYYLDHLNWGGDWVKFYNNEPTNFTGTEEQKKLILGGEACLWAEVVDENNVIARTWPRASAVAEKLWSAIDADTAPNAAHRLEEHTCRMNKRGIKAQPPNGPGFCVHR